MDHTSLMSTQRRTYLLSTPYIHIYTSSFKVIKFLKFLCTFFFTSGSTEFLAAHILSTSPEWWIDIMCLIWFQTLS